VAELGAGEEDGEAVEDDLVAPGDPRPGDVDVIRAAVARCERRERAR
jgi:hypothetical protein